MTFVNDELLKSPASSTSNTAGRQYVRGTDDDEIESVLSLFDVRVSDSTSLNATFVNGHYDSTNLSAGNSKQIRHEDLALWSRGVYNADLTGLYLLVRVTEDMRGVVTINEIYTRTEQIGLPEGQRNRYQ